MDLGFHSMVSRALLMHVTADQGRCRAVLHNADTLSHTVHSMDSRADKQKFLEQHHGAFMIPKRLEFQGQPTEDTVEPDLQKALHSEMEARLQHLGQRVSNLRTESEEIWKTLETAEINLLEILNTKVYNRNIAQLHVLLFLIVVCFGYRIMIVAVILVIQQRNRPNRKV